MEDDVSRVVERLDETLDRVVAQLPSGWQFCFVGYHESTGELLPPGKRVRMAELGVDEGQTGLFAYLLKRSAAVELLADRDVFPLRHQIDVAVRSHPRPRVPRARPRSDALAHLALPCGSSLLCARSSAHAIGGRCRGSR